MKRKGGINLLKKAQKKDERKEEYLKAVSREDKFLKSQKGSDVEGKKNFHNYQEFQKNPSEHLINLYKKALGREYEKLEAVDPKNKEEIEMHLGNLELFSRKIALFKEFGQEAENEFKKEFLEEGSYEENTLELELSVNKKFLDRKFAKSVKSKFAKVIRPLKYTALALMFSSQVLIGSGQEKNQEKGREDLPDKNKLEDTRTIKGTETTHSSGKNYHLTLDDRFTKENKEGERSSNIIGGIIAPVSLELSTDKTTDGRIETRIPFTYAKDFKTTDFTNKEDSQKMEKYLREKMQEEFANKLFRVGETKGVYRANHKGEKNLLEKKSSKSKINSIRITGYASPEAGTDKSVVPGNKESQNEKLAEIRAEAVKKIVEKILNENEVDLSVLEKVKFEEVQFLDNEWSSLVNLADSLEIKGLNPESKIIELVSRYNGGEFNDNKEVKKIMDEIVGSKREVVIEVDYENNEKTQVVVPIPLILLLLIPILRKRPTPTPDSRPRPMPEPELKPDQKLRPEPELKPDQKLRPEPALEPEPITRDPRQIFSEKDINKEDVSAGEFNYYESYEKAENGIHAQDIYNIKKHFLERELYEYLDDEFSIENGLDYRKLIDSLYSSHDRYNTEKELEIEISRRLLDMWQDYDRNIRKNAGIEIDKETTLDYRHDSKKILWAKVAASEILKLVRGHDNSNDLFKRIEEIVQKNKEDNEEMEKNNEEAEGKELEENKISREEYDWIYDDLKMLNGKIQSSDGIIALSKESFKSQYGQKRYEELSHISEEAEKPILFNKHELQIIGDEMEGVLSRSVIEKEKTELEKAQEEEKDIFAEFRKFTESHPTERVPIEMEERYRRAEERLRRAQEEAN